MSEAVPKKRNDVTPNYLTLQSEDSVDNRAADLDGDLDVHLKSPDLSVASTPLLSGQQSSYERLLPVLLILASSVLMSGSNCCIRYITTVHHVPINVIVFFRGATQLLTASVLTLCLGLHNVSGSFSVFTILWLSIRGLLGAAVILLKCATLARLPVGVGISLLCTSPIFASLMGWLFLGQGLTATDRVSLLITTAGSALVGLSDPSSLKMAGEISQQTHVQGVLFGLLTAGTVASVFVLMRSMGTRIHFVLCVFAHSVGSIVAAVFIYLMQNGDLKGSVPFFVDTLLHSGPGAAMGLLGVALFGVCGSLFLNSGTQLIAPGRTAVLRSFDIPINFLAALIFLGEFPNSPMQLIGCVMMATSTYLMAAIGASYVR